MSEGEQENGKDVEGASAKPELNMPDVSPEEALAAFMQVDPEKVREADKSGREQSDDQKPSGEDND